MLWVSENTGIALFSVAPVCLSWLSSLLRDSRSLQRIVNESMIKRVNTFRF